MEYGTSLAGKDGIDGSRNDYLRSMTKEIDLVERVRRQKHLG